MTGSLNRVRKLCQQAAVAWVTARTASASF